MSTSGTEKTAANTTTGQRNPVLHIDTANVYTPQVGNEGVSPSELAAIDQKLRQVHQRLLKGSNDGLEAEYACLNLPHHMSRLLPKIEQMAHEISRFPDIVLIGIGGSSLGSKAVWHALNGASQKTRLHFVENADPYDLHRLLSRLSPTDTAVICISKSGGTMETIAQYLILRGWLSDKLGNDQALKRQWIITDPETGWLRRLAQRENIASLPVPPKVGGRYSVLSPVGLLPLTALGVDARALLRGAADNAARCAAEDLRLNPALEMAALYFLLDVKKNKRISIMMPYINRLRFFVDWYCQLWAESLGKKNAANKEPAGSLPVRAVGTIDQHSQLQMYLESRYDKVFTFIELAHWEHNLSIPLGAEDREAFPYLKEKTLADVMHAEFNATRETITKTGHPNLTIRLPRLDAYILGQLIDLYQRVTIYTGQLYGINPLDQPAVEEGKKLAVRYLLRE